MFLANMVEDSLKNECQGRTDVLQVTQGIKWDKQKPERYLLPQEELWGAAFTCVARAAFISAELLNGE